MVSSLQIRYNAVGGGGELTAGPVEHAVPKPNVGKLNRLSVSPPPPRFLYHGCPQEHAPDPHRARSLRR